MPFENEVGARSARRELLGPNSAWITRFGNPDKLIERLQKAGKTTGDRATDLSRHRWEQITWAALGLVAGVPCRRDVVFCLGEPACIRGHGRDSHGAHLVVRVLH